MEEVLEQLPYGAFLTVAAETRKNTMTIGWATAGIIWSRPVMTVAVRSTRFTYELLKDAVDFTVSVPRQGSHTNELAICGKRSGRDIDKFEQTGLQPRPAKETSSPVLELPGLHFECRILLRTPMEPARMHAGLTDVYPAKDYHTFYYGEIEAAYRLEK